MIETTPRTVFAHIDVGAGDAARRIAIAHLPAIADATALPGIVWLGGYRSDMAGTKAVAVEALAERMGAACIRFDYSGHGASGGAFRDGTISRWLEESLAVIDHAGMARMVLVGSSMGGWIALRAIAALRERGEGSRIAGLLLIAPAPDFTVELIEPNLSEREQQSLAEKGYFEEPTPYGPEPNVFTRALIDDGRLNRVLSGPIDTGCPVHILHGMNDAEVPYALSLKLTELLSSDDVTVSLVRDGNHRLSRKNDLDKLEQALSLLLQAD